MSPCSASDETCLISSVLSKIRDSPCSVPPPLGDDVYLWNLGDGNDTIDDVHGKSVLKFGAGISRENLRAIPVHVEENVWRSGIRPRSTTPPIPWRNAVRLVVGETGESVLIKNWPGVLLYDHGKVSGIEPIIEDRKSVV